MLSLFEIIFYRSSSSCVSEQIATNDHDLQSELTTDDDTDIDEYSTSEEEEEEEQEQQQFNTSLEEENDENDTSTDQPSTDEYKYSSSSEDEQNDQLISLNVVTDPTLIQFLLLITRVRELTSVVHKSSNLHEHIRQQKKEKELLGEVSSE